MKLDKDKIYLLACSFGPDSMALLHMLYKGGFCFSVALVNYHLREESDMEMVGLINYCDKYHIKTHILDFHGSFTGNLEKSCRDIRYNFFKEIISQFGYDSLLVAHHEDDLLETYLLQKERKNLVLYYGLKEDTYIFDIKVKRPLLSYTKKELLTYCLDNDIPYAIDKTNLGNDFKRNRIRHEIVEKLDEEDRRELREEIFNLNKEITKILEHISTLDLHDNKTMMELYTESKMMFYYAINELVKRHQKDLSISSKLCDEIYKILISKKSNVSFKIKDNLFFEKSYSLIYFTDAKKIDYCYIIDRPCVLDTEYFFLDFTKVSSNRNVKDDDYPLKIRTISKRDLINIKSVTSSASRWMINCKIPLFLRRRWPVIEDKDGKIIYSPRYQKDFKDYDNSNFFVKNTTFK